MRVAVASVIAYVGGKWARVMGSGGLPTVATA